ncbi:hypothetical protein WN73_13375 [Bradyrhizobium sp. CCBAU 45394]|nr:hypothetical protein [Bradyrhizobium sp. CCBAU 45394]MDA9537118.1 hypothetical protein [Bradyrhizobium sp. CCBAU 21362]
MMWRERFRRPADRRAVGLAQALPFPGQQFVQTRGGKIGDASEDVGEPGFRVDVVEACGGDEGEHDGGAVGAALGAGEGPVAPSQCDAPQRSFGRVVAEADPPSSRKRAKSSQRLSM